MKMGQRLPGRSRIDPDMLPAPPVRLRPPCRRPVLIGTNYLVFRGQETLSLWPPRDFRAIYSGHAVQADSTPIRRESFFIRMRTEIITGLSLSQIGFGLLQLALLLLIQHALDRLAKNLHVDR